MGRVLVHVMKYSTNKQTTEKWERGETNYLARSRQLRYEILQEDVGVLEVESVDHDLDQLGEEES